jgi:SP family general alpha glucoside:H+ symporter-like MFS transporter
MSKELIPVLTTWVNACWGVGQLLSVGILEGLLSKTYLGQWGWRIPYALQVSFVPRNVY